MEAVSAEGTCLFTTYAVLPALLLNKPGGIAARLVNKLAPAADVLLGSPPPAPADADTSQSAAPPYPGYPAGHRLQNAPGQVSAHRRAGLYPGTPHQPARSCSRDDTLPRRLLEEGATPGQAGKMLKNTVSGGWTPRRRTFQRAVVQAPAGS